MSNEAKEKLEKNSKFVTLQSIYDGYAEKAEKDGKDVEVDIIALHAVEFTKDFVSPAGVVMIPKGHKQNVSTVMKDWYSANGVIKVIETDKNVEEKKTVKA